jgi:hypothetical protein
MPFKEMIFIIRNGLYRLIPETGSHKSPELGQRPRHT